jgi:DNA (cytosine-5)-methyltransferase 1
LTPRERSRLQTFRPDFSFAGSNTDIDLMVANAVPVALAEHLARAICEYEEDRGMARTEDEFRRWLSQKHSYTPRAAGNVVSRLRRAKKILGADRIPSDPLDVIHALEKRAAFRDLTTSVRSQLKRAIQLHSSFREGA